jgi:hypothetical protein
VERRDPVVGLADQRRAPRLAREICDLCRRAARGITRAAVAAFLQQK